MKLSWGEKKPTQKRRSSLERWQAAENFQQEAAALKKPGRNGAFT